MTDNQTKQIEERLIRIIIGSRKIDPTSVTSDTSLGKLGVESLDAVAIVFDIEAEFKVTIPDSEVYQLKTVGDVFTSVTQLLQAQKGSENP